MCDENNNINNNNFNKSNQVKKKDFEYNNNMEPKDFNNSEKQSEDLQMFQQKDNNHLQQFKKDNRQKRFRIQKGEVDWKYLEDVPFIIWYPPVQLPPYSYEEGAPEPQGPARFFNYEKGMKKEEELVDMSSINLKKRKDFQSLESDIAREMNKYKRQMNVEQYERIQK